MVQLATNHRTAIALGRDLDADDRATGLLW